MENRPENDAEDHNGAHKNPHGVAAGVAGLHVTYAIADFPDAVTDAVDGAVNRALVYGFPQDVAGNPDQRANDRRLIKFIDVVLVVQKLVQPCLTGPRFTSFAIHAPRHDQAQCGCNRRYPRKREFERMERLSAGDFAGAEHR